MTARIPGGYILLSRRVLDSSIWNQPPIYFKVWVYILMKATHKEGDAGRLGRGQCLIRYDEIQDAASYLIGYRKKRPTKAHIAKILRSFREGNMIETTKTTRGLVVTICNYATYQDAKLYDGNDEGNAKATRRQQSGSTIDKKGRMEEGQEKEKTPKPPAGAAPDSPLRITAEGIYEYAAQKITERYGRKWRVNSRKDRVSLIARVLKRSGITPDDLRYAVDRFCEDTWEDRGVSRYCDMNQIWDSQIKLTRWLEMKPGEAEAALLSKKSSGPHYQNLDEIDDADL